MRFRVEERTDGCCVSEAGAERASASAFGFNEIEWEETGQQGMEERTVDLSGVVQGIVTHVETV